MIFADKLIGLRKKNGWSQEELAEKLGVSRQTVSKWESAQSTPDLDRVLKLARLFDVSTDYLLRDEMEAEESAHVESAEPAEVRRVSMEEANAFLQAKEQTADRIAWAAFLCILSPVCLLMLGAAADCNLLSENVAGGVGLIVLALMVIAAVVTFIRCGAVTSAYEYLDTDSIETEYGVSGMVREMKRRYHDTYTNTNTVSTALCIFSVVPLFAAVFLTGNMLWLMGALSLLMVLAGLGVVGFIRVGIRWASYQKLLQEEDYTPKTKRIRNSARPLATAYWLLATALYLAISFITNEWEYSWIVWPVAGVAYPAVLALYRAFHKE